MENIGVCVIVLHSNNKQVLLGKRKSKYRKGFYGLPGGRMELNESLYKSAERELFEETSLKAKSIRYLGVIRERQVDFNFIHFVFVSDDYEGQPINTEPEKCEGWKWYYFDKLPKNTVPAHKAACEMYISKNSTLKELL